jgi:uncharacterized protein (TIGR02001 family)
MTTDDSTRAPPCPDLRAVAAGLAVAAALLVPTALASDSGRLKVEADLTQRYVWRGLDLLDGHGALQPAVTWEAGGGWYVGVWASLSLERGSGCREIEGDVCREWDEVDLYAGRAGSLGAGARWRADWDTSLTYFAFPYQPRSADTLELALEVRHPQLLGPGLPVPRWAVYYNRGAQEPGEEGIWVIPGLDQGVSVAGVPITIGAEVAFKDGDAGLWRYSGFTHALLTLSTEITVGGWTFTPRVSAQQSLVSDRPGVEPFSGVWLDLVISRVF